MWWCFKEARKKKKIKIHYWNIECVDFFCFCCCFLFLHHPPYQYAYTDAQRFDFWSLSQRQNLPVSPNIHSRAHVELMKTKEEVRDNWLKDHETVNDQNRNFFFFSPSFLIFWLYFGLFYSIICFVVLETLIMLSKNFFSLSSLSDVCDICWRSQ